MCRFSKLLLFSFFFCKDGSDRLMKRASYSCCNFLCIVLAAAYLKYHWCRLSCLPFVWHPFFHCDTHMHTHIHTHTYTKTHTYTQQFLQCIFIHNLTCSKLKKKLQEIQTFFGEPADLCNTTKKSTPTHYYFYLSIFCWDVFTLKSHKCWSGKSKYSVCQMHSSSVSMN